jgi:hypothetical protein
MVALLWVMLGCWPLTCGASIKLTFLCHGLLTVRRYVIDFYNGAPSGLPVAVHLDVRPALDSGSALWDRLKMQWEWVTGGGLRAAARPTGSTQTAKY